MKDSVVRLQEPYEARRIALLERWELGGWRLKVYGIAHQKDRPAPELVARARELAESTLPRPATAEGRYGVGFVGVHEGRGADFVFVDWWADENELHHHVFSGPANDPQGLREITASGLVACCWDLRVLSFERDAWVDTVPRRAEGPSIEAYLDRTLEEVR